MSKKSRYIHGKIRLSMSFSKLTFRQRDLWHGLIVTADDQGRLPGNINAVKSLIFPYDDIDRYDVELDLKALADLDYIVLYSEEDSRYIQIVNWWKYQKSQWAGESNYPSPEGWVDRVKHHGPGRKIIYRNWDQPGGFVLTDNDKDKDSVKDKDNDKDKPLTQRFIASGGQGNNDKGISQRFDTKVYDKGLYDRNIFRHYENNIGQITPIMSDVLIAAESDYPESWIIEAIDLAVYSNVRRWSYVKGILENWVRDGKGDKKGKTESQKLSGEFIE